MTEMAPLEIAALAPGIRSRFVQNINGLRVHLLEAGFEARGRPLVLLLHGFPELAYSWRKVMLPLAAAGFHAVAPDLRGYGRTTGWDADYDGDLASFRILNAVRDALGLVSALGYRDVALVAGHDFGASVAAWCALVRPDVFRSLSLMSAPFAGPPSLPFDTANNSSQPASSEVNIHDELAKLDRPRKHYQWYYSTRPANADMHNCPQGVHAFLRGYFHCKSADWTDNKPFRLKSWTASELAKMPTYYIMDLHKNMAETVAADMPSPAQIAACRWLPDNELAVYAGEYERAGFPRPPPQMDLAAAGVKILAHEICNHGPCRIRFRRAYTCEHLHHIRSQTADALDLDVHRQPSVLRVGAPDDPSRRRKLYGGLVAGIGTNDEVPSLAAGR